MNDETTINDRMHNVVLIIITVASLGAVVESITQGWEFWVPPLIFVGLASGWIIHVTHYGKSTLREHYYLIFCMLVSFFHGVHESSFFDVVVISLLLMLTITLFGHREYLILILVEYFLLMILQLFLAIKGKTMEFNALLISRIFLHCFVEVCAFRVLSVIIRKTSKNEEALERQNTEKECTKLEMEDFLVNISHELRTPVNVINGLSSLILKKEDREDVIAIREAGERLARQIEDIQDYSEIQRGDVVLEEDKYMIISLLNDIIAEFRGRDNKKNLEFIVDIDPNVPCTLMGDVNKLKKILHHMLSNAYKFTKRGGVYLKVSGIMRDYGINLMFEVSDTGIGIKEKYIDMLSKGGYQTDRKRNRSTGGIGLGLPIVYGFVRAMDGFVSIESQVKEGTTVKVCISQEIVNPEPCLSVNSGSFVNIALCNKPDKYKVNKIRDFYRNMATNLASGLRINLYSASNIKECENLVDRGGITHVFTGMEEYSSNSDYFDYLATKNIVVIVAASYGFKVKEGSCVQLMPKPLYGGSIVKAINGDANSFIGSLDNYEKPMFDGVRALVVDDEPMNLVVATGLFKDYNMITETASSGIEAIKLFNENDYDIVFMDHMMPEMDGIVAMNRIRNIAQEKQKRVVMIALTANAISGAKEMFMREGFDGFISKPIDINSFERTMLKVKPALEGARGGLNETD
ncbi:hybrid sensor histidine kinase/response regulator [Butyrivibrio sp. MC2021]|uniref:hybrid sensor histidine kinase/response regulator n=1 Tax=Butyrivibrio sp. MC2021 TaxID=1408306 RepID=UPI00047CF748|nr:response regulator [Butyrivibrio sp. MC2021]